MEYEKVNVRKSITIFFNIKFYSTESPPSSKARRLSIQCGGYQRPAHFNSVTLTPYPPLPWNLWAPFLNFFIIHPRNFLKSKWCIIWFKYRSCSCTFSVFFNNKQKMYCGPCTSPSVLSEIHIYRYILDIKHYFHQISR